MESNKKKCKLENVGSYKPHLIRLCLLVEMGNWTKYEIKFRSNALVEKMENKKNNKKVGNGTISIWFEDISIHIYGHASERKNERINTSEPTWNVKPLPFSVSAYQRLEMHGYIFLCFVYHVGFSFFVGSPETWINVVQQWYSVSNVHSGVAVVPLCRYAKTLSQFSC